MITSAKILSDFQWHVTVFCVFPVQFADGVILLLLIGQLEGFFIPLFDFNLTPVNESEMVYFLSISIDIFLVIEFPILFGSKKLFNFKVTFFDH